MSRFAMACVLASLAVGCRPQAPKFAQPPPYDGPLVTHPVPPPPPPDPGGPCVVEFTFPATAQVGHYPSFEVEARPPIVYRGQGAQPTARVVIEAPDGTSEERVVPLVTQPVCAYCLPAPGSSGCEHDCRWEPFSATVESLQLKVPGLHRVSVQLRDSSCTVRGGQARIEGVMPPANERR